MGAVRITIIAVFLSLLSLTVKAQVSQVEKLYKKYSSVKEVTAAKVGGMMLGAIRLTTKNFPKGVKDLTVIVMNDLDKVSDSVKMRFRADISDAVKDLEYIESGEHEGIHAQVYAQSFNKKSNKLKNIVVWIHNDKMITLMEMIGVFDPDQDFTKI